MDTITSLVGVLETELEGGEPTTSLSSLNALYALYALQNRAEAAEAEIERLRSQVVTLEAQLQEVRTEYRVACEDFNDRRQFAYSVLAVLERCEEEAD